MIIKYINFKGYCHKEKANSWNFNSTAIYNVPIYYYPNGCLWLSFRITRI